MHVKQRHTAAFACLKLCERGLFRVGKYLRKIGKFYSSMIMGNVGLFLTVGLLSVLFHEEGWFPNGQIFDASQFLYTCILPVFLAYAGGEKISGATGGILAVLLASGCLAADMEAGMLAGLLAAPVGGCLWKYAGEPWKKKAALGMQMLAGNLLVGAAGCLLTACGYYLLSPLLQTVSAWVVQWLSVLTEKRLFWVLNVIVEPAKVLFLNNIINHGVLAPLGLGQMKEAGGSLLFLVEANPGPGLGVLAALYCREKESRARYATAMLTEAVGGIHEVYFPEVLSDPWLLLPLIAAGVSGTCCFQMTGCVLRGPASPGSFLTILLMAGKENLLFAAAGMVISTAVSFCGSLIVLSGKKKPGNSLQIANGCGIAGGACNVPREENVIEESAKGEAQVPDRESNQEKKEPIRFIAFVCDAGMGSSAMGAALFRRKLKQAGLEDIRTEAYAVDSIPQEADVAVCQKDFLRLLPDGIAGTEIFVIDSLTDGAALEELMQMILERNG